MAIRTITYSVDKDSISPKTVQWGGMQYEDNATEVVFHVEIDLYAELKGCVWRVDFNSSAGYDVGASTTEVTVRRPIPYKFTCGGSKLQATFVATKLDEENNAVQTVLSYPVFIEFTAVKRDAAAVEKAENSFSELEMKLREDLANGAFKGDKGDKGDTPSLDGYVKNTDYATEEKAGVLKVGYRDTGLQLDASKYLKIAPANKQEIAEKVDGYNPIVPLFLDYAVKVGLTTNTIPLTDEEKTTAQEWLGINMGDIETALDKIIAIQNTLIGGESE